MPLIELSTALVAAGSSVAVPFANKVLEKSAQRLGGHVDEHLAALFTRAYSYLAATGREAQSVEAKVAIPLMQAASLESDHALTEKWAALLANAADPAQKSPVQPSFVEVLRQLTPTDAHVVAAIYEAAEGASGTEQQHTVATEGLMSKTSLLEQEMRLSIDNLLRLQLCKPVLTYGGYSTESFQMPSALLMTTLGLRFVQAVTPPSSNISWPFSH